LPDKELNTENALFERIAEGEEQALDLLYEHLRPKMEGYVLKLMKKEEAVMDILQEAMIRLWLNRDKLPSIQYPLTWFFKIIGNECFRYMRRYGIPKTFLSQLEYSYQGEVSRSTELDISYRETQRIIQQVIASLPPRNREIYQLSREQGLKMQEIADKTGLSFLYVKKVLVATLKMMRQKLREAGKYTSLLLFWLFI